MKFSFFKKLFGKAKSSVDKDERTPEKLAKVDARKAECPYCGGMLAKVPAKKTKCPHCGEFMYVRTSPTDNARKVVTKAQADKIAEDWELVSGTQSTSVFNKEQAEQERAVHRSKFGKEASEDDVRWGLLNKSLIEHARRGDWGLYRNDRFAMGQVLRKALRLNEALVIYLEVCYLDLNGPNNTGGITDSDLLTEFPPFDPADSGMLAPGVLDIIRRIIKKLEIDETKLYSTFLIQNARVFAALKLPLSPEQCWPSIRNELWTGSRDL